MNNTPIDDGACDSDERDSNGAAAPSNLIDNLVAAAIETGMTVAVDGEGLHVWGQIPRS